MYTHALEEHFALVFCDHNQIWVHTYLDRLGSLREHWVIICMSSLHFPFYWDMEWKTRTFCWNCQINKDGKWRGRRRKACIPILHDDIPLSSLMNRPWHHWRRTVISFSPLLRKILSLIRKCIWRNTTVFT